MLSRAVSCSGVTIMCTTPHPMANSCLSSCCSLTSK
uniref:Uncharacterized protein n=1 Tax=Triticum urartu TaxID=4572 RepID=A0A8R7UZ18_TRIUA